MFLKSVFLTSVILISYTQFFGQSGFPYESEWKLIDSLTYKKNLPESALVEINKVYEAAKKDNLEAQWVKAIIRLNQVEYPDEQNINQVAGRMEKEISQSPPRVAAILKSTEADLLHNYFVRNRYKMSERTETMSDTSTDMDTWPIGRVNEKIRSLYLSSIADPALLKQTSVDVFDAALLKGNSRDLRPTLYDLLAWRVLEYFKTSHSPLGDAFVENTLENPALFSEAPFFMHYDFSDNDSLSDLSIVIGVYQQLLRFHSKDARTDAEIDADISRIQFVYQYTNMQGKDSLYMNALERITRGYPTLSVASEAWYLQARWWADQAALYDPLKDSLHRYDYIKAIDLCEKAVDHPDSSEGRSKCEELLMSIHRKSMMLKTERVNIPDQPFRLLVSYRNISHLYGHVIRINEALQQALERRREDSAFWNRLIGMPFERNIQQAIPETNDYQEHNVEIKINALGIGQYALLISSDAAFSDTGCLGLIPFFCSGIAYVANGNDYFVLDRDSGHPIKGVTVETFTEQYKKGKSIYVPAKTYQTDLHGNFHLTSQNKNLIQKLDFYSGKDYLSTNTYATYYRDEDEIRTDHNAKLIDNIFTDRSIYRPCQTIFFKSLFIMFDKATGKYKPAARHRARIYLIDVNDQKVDSIGINTNDFGSCSGSFRLPQNLLNGEFTIRDGETQNGETISVEEYKRPAFYIEYDSVKGSYKVGDTIQVGGSALAYAGNQVAGAKLSYRVFRQSRFPYSWMFRFNTPNRERQIIHGESQTDSSGHFIIRFPARPDKSVAKNIEPIYSYRVEATITDAGGESRTAASTVEAGYQSFQIVSTLADKILKDSLTYLPVTTKNLSGVFLKKRITVTIYPLEGPTRLIRERYWEQPDQFVMTEQEFIRSFPNDEYRNETDVKSRNQLPPVFEKTDSTNEDGLFAIDRKVVKLISPGWYLFEFRATDLNGEEIKDKRFVEVSENENQSAGMQYNQVPYEEFTAEPGSQVTIHTGSGAKELFVIRLKQMTGDSIAGYSFYGLNEQMNTSNVDIKEKDRGGFALNDVFVKNNRWYTSEHKILVPWTNKELKISYQTWKDKTLPGSKEQWKIKISGNRKEQVSAEILTSMYDASLDQFRNHTWAIPDLYSVYGSENNWSGNDNFRLNASQNRYIREWPVIFYEQSYDHLIYSNDDIVTYGYSAKKGVVVKSLGIQSAPASHMIELAKYTPPRIVADNEALPAEEKHKSDSRIQIRKNLNETAFFQPDLKTDAEGNVEISFTMPEALTQWKWMVLANTKDLSFGYSEQKIITQKELMVQPNMPRFFREGDTMMLPVKISNLSSQTLTGTVQLEWLNAGNDLNEDFAVNNIKSKQSFMIDASQTSMVSFPAVIPGHFDHPLLYRITAKTNSKGTEYSDGEQNTIPVLSNRMLVTESIPLNMNGRDEKHFVLEKLVKSNESPGLQNHSLTVEYTTNPAWCAVQSLPYLMEFPYECAEQTFNRFYANTLAGHIVQVSPGIQTIFEKWKNADTAALLGNLQKSEELKSVLLRETPWVLEAKNETEQKKNIALLFDMVRMKIAVKSAIEKLQQMQSDGGGFPWFKDGRDDRYITQYIISGIGRLRKLNAIPGDLQPVLDNIARSAISFLDDEIKSDYEKRDKSAKRYDIGAIQIQYLYMRSYFTNEPVPARVSIAFDFYKRLAASQWMNQPVYMQGMIALFLNRSGDAKTAEDILVSLKENASESEELGMYWKTVTNGYYWQEAPIETQSLLIEAFTELHAEQNTIDNMKYWLLQQKHTTHWPTTKSTADACYALLLNGGDWLSNHQDVSIRLGDYKINSYNEKSEAGTGYFKTRISGDSIKPDMGNILVSISRQPLTVNRQPSWGAIYWQYFENLDKITSVQTQLSVSKNLFIERNSDKGTVLDAVSSTNILKPGDKLIMRIIIRTDRDLEYVHLKDMRASCLEPVNVLSGYRWQDGLGYYETTQDASTSFFFDLLPKGTHVFEYPVFVTTAGNYSNGISTLECMYAPEFSAHSEGVRVHVEPK